MVFFVALDNTMVTSVVLVSQIEAPIMLALSSLVLGERLGPWAIVGAALCVLGVSLTLLLQPAADSGFMIGKGEFFAAAAAVIYAVSTVIARPRLKQIPVGIFVVFRNGVGTVAFFIAAIYLYGPEHFIDLASPFLWQWMLVYGGIIIVSGQLAWYTGLAGARAVDVSLATSATPIAGVLGAFLILGEHPMPAHYAGGAVVVVGILIGLLGGRSKTAAAEEKLPAPPAATGSMLQSECRTGFRGV